MYYVFNENKNNNNQTREQQTQTNEKQKKYAKIMYVQDNIMLI